MKKIWLVHFPTHQFKEDVKALAKQNNLKIIDARYSHQIRSELVEQNPPSLTKKGVRRKPTTATPKKVETESTAE